MGNCILPGTLHVFMFVGKRETYDCPWNYAPMNCSSVIKPPMSPMKIIDKSTWKQCIQLPKGAISKPKFARLDIPIHILNRICFGLFSFTLRKNLDPVPTFQMGPQLFFLMMRSLVKLSRYTALVYTVSASQYQTTLSTDSKILWPVDQIL